MHAILRNLVQRASIVKKPSFPNQEIRLSSINHPQNDIYLTYDGDRDNKAHPNDKEVFCSFYC